MLILTVGSTFTAFLEDTASVGLSYQHDLGT